MLDKISWLTPTKRAFRKFIRPILLIGLVVFIFSEIIVLTPDTLEKNESSDLENYLDPAEILAEMQGDHPFLASDIPKDRIPDYHLSKLHYISSKEGQREWKIISESAHLYKGAVEKSDLVHGFTVTALIYNPEGKPTIISGKEAKYVMGKKDLEIFGDVITTFPDGFRIHSEYTQYQTQDRTIFIPENYTVRGKGKTDSQKDVEFQSEGLSYPMGKNEVFLPKGVHFKITSIEHDKKKNRGIPQVNTIDSDQCTIYRSQNLAIFTMYPSRPAEERFVQAHQPQFSVRSRKIHVNYGDYSKLVNYMTAYDDVYLRETDGNQTVRYGTGGQADFNTQKNVIVLSKYPQVYQGKDTITGEIIVIHRDSDIVEIEYSNAYREGKRSEPNPGAHGQSPR